MNYDTKLLNVFQKNPFNSILPSKLLFEATVACVFHAGINLHPLLLGTLSFTQLYTAASACAATQGTGPELNQHTFGKRRKGGEMIFILLSFPAQPHTQSLLTQQAQTL